jgi:hypothetical protein
MYREDHSAKRVTDVVNLWRSGLFGYVRECGWKVEQPVVVNGPTTRLSLSSRLSCGESMPTKVHVPHIEAAVMQIDSQAVLGIEVPEMMVAADAMTQNHHRCPGVCVVL